MSLGGGGGMGYFAGRFLSKCVGLDDVYVYYRKCRYFFALCNKKKSSEVLSPDNVMIVDVDGGENIDI